MKIKQNMVSKDTGRYEAPVVDVFECITEGTLCMSVESSTEKYTIYDELDW